MCIAENPAEIVLGERLAVAAEQLAGAYAHIGCASHLVRTACERFHRAAHEIERLIAREPFAGCADLGISSRALDGSGGLTSLHCAITRRARLTVSVLTRRALIA